jgi:DNA-directed RNA polymerase subunit F
MPDLELIKERPITMAELSEDLISLEKKEELNFRSNKTKAYLNSFKIIPFKEAKELAKKIEDLEIPRLKERQVVKIIDTMPQTLDELRMIFSGETTTVNDDNLKKIIEVMKEYVKKK